MKLNELSADERQYAINVISGIIRDKHDKGCKNACIECSKDSKGCARDPGGFEWKYKGILEKVIELLREPEPVNDKKELKEAKRLLKAAVEAIYELLDCGAACSGSYCDKYCVYSCETCPLNEVEGTNDCSEWRKWKHEAEALKLIGEDGDTE